MFGLTRPCGNGVNVQIQGGLNNGETSYARLFCGLFQRYFGQVSLAVGVAARLQPSAQLHVMKDQRCIAAGIDNGGRSGEVTAQAGSKQGITVGSTKLENLVAVGGLS